jgi:protein arginine N-methyltransferase 5
MYRQTDDRKVWYEWMIEVYALERKPTPASGSRAGSPSVENLKIKENTAKQTRPGYRRVRVGMSDLHSSIKDGCLM